MEVKVYTLNSFTKNGKGGNPAGVVLEADALSEGNMKRIANKVGFSETAFVQKSNKADFKVRFFTPNAEVDLCGHATIATFFLLENSGVIHKGKYTQETKAGILDIDVMGNGTVFMSQNPPQFFEEISKKEIAECLKISEEQLIPKLPAQIVSTGLREIMVPIKNLETLLSIEADFDKILDLSKKYRVVGLHVFSLETKLGSTAQCRNFAPLYDVPEESATGTATGALSSYLFKHHKITEEQANNLVFEQGYSMNKPSEILAKLRIENNEIKGVQVGGTATITKEINLSI